MKYITDDGVKTAFLTMMNKLIFAHQMVLKPLLHSLQGYDDKDRLLQIQEYESKLEKNMEQIPTEYILSDNVRKTILKYDRIDTDSDGIFPIGITNWEVVHAKNPTLSKDKYHRTNNNLSKTRQLYPAIYLATKDMDITIIYGTMPGDKTEKMKKGQFD